MKLPEVRKRGEGGTGGAGTADAHKLGGHSTVTLPFTHLSSPVPASTPRPASPSTHHCLLGARGGGRTARRVPGAAGGTGPLGSGGQGHGPGAGQGVAGRASPPDGPWRATLHSPPLSQGRGCLQIKRGEKKLLNFSPNTVVEAGPEGGACPVIRGRFGSGGSDWRAQSGAGKSGRGGGERPALPAGWARAGSGLISNRGLDCSGTVTLPLLSRRPASPGSGVSSWHPPRRRKDRLTARLAGLRSRSGEEVPRSPRSNSARSGREVN